MYRLLQRSSSRELVLNHLPSLTIALVISESTFKLGSFTLECLAFLITWYVTDFALSRFLR